MNVLIPAVLCILFVLAQFVYPQTHWFHHGSYAALLLALIAIQWWQLRRHRHEVLAACGATLIGIAGLASSLFGPETQTIVAGPGQVVPLTEPSGVLQFPVSQPPTAPVLRRQGRSDVTVVLGGRRTFLANYILWTQSRTAAYIQAFDAAGAHLTLTQPQSTNASFLSPILLFGESKTFQNQNLAVDSFSLPAVHRNINAVLFTADAIGTLQKISSDPRPGILFAVSGDRGRTLPGGIGMARTGDTIALAGVRLRPVIEDFPTVVIASAPYLPVTVLGLLLFAVAGVKNQYRSRT
ncbi:MAG: hypothetical protein ABR584_12235 [Candidatus Baltobacteraceae bacterium]